VRFTGRQPVTESGRHRDAADLSGLARPFQPNVFKLHNRARRHAERDGTGARRTGILVLYVAKSFSIHRMNQSRAIGYDDAFVPFEIERGCGLFRPVEAPSLLTGSVVGKVAGFGMPAGRWPGGKDKGGHSNSRTINFGLS
jgi:hypothetical protein